MMRRKVGAETLIRSELDPLWDLALDPDQHARWDIRFTSITPLNEPGQHTASKFRYATRIGFGMEITGWGESAGERHGRSSGLRFGSDHPLSLIRAGAGGWMWRKEGDFVRFWTLFNYDVRGGVIGKAVDRMFRPLMAWGTQWSFDRLRLWVETGQSPESLFRKWMLQQTVRAAFFSILTLFTLNLFGTPTPFDLYNPSSSQTGFGSTALHVALVFLSAASLLFFSERWEGWAVAITTLAGLGFDAAQWGQHAWFILAISSLGLISGLFAHRLPAAKRGRPTEQRRRIPGGGVLPELVDNESATHPTPFFQLLEHQKDALHPTIAHHFLTPGRHKWAGEMDIVERPKGLVGLVTGPFLHAGALMQAIFPNTGTNIPFELDHEAWTDRHGQLRMRWLRRFYFPSSRQDDPPVVRRFDAHMFHRPRDQYIVDDLGSTGILRVRLTPSIRADGGISIRSSHPSLRLFGGRLLIPLPGFLTPQARIEEWPLDKDDPNSNLGIDVDVRLWGVGSILHYRGWHGPLNDESE